MYLAQAEETGQAVIGWRKKNLRGGTGNKLLLSRTEHKPTALMVPFTVQNSYRLDGRIVGSDCSSVAGTVSGASLAPRF